MRIEQRGAEHCTIIRYTLSSSIPSINPTFVTYFHLSPAGDIVYRMNQLHKLSAKHLYFCALLDRIRNMSLCVPGAEAS